MVQRSHPYMTIGKIIALTRWTFVGKIMSLLFNVLSRLVIAFLPRSKRLWTSQLQSLSAVMMEPKKIKNKVTTFIKKQGASCSRTTWPRGSQLSYGIPVIKVRFYFPLGQRQRNCPISEPWSFTAARTCFGGRTTPISDTCTADVRNPFPLPLPFMQSKCWWV